MDRPKPKATSQRRRWTIGRRWLSAASITDSAITDSTSRKGSSTSDSAAAESVIECATVKAVATLNTSQNAVKRSTA